MTILFIIIVILIIIDIYLKLKNHTRHIEFLLFSNDVINKSLANKKIIDKKVLVKAQKEVLDNFKATNPERYKNTKESLSKMGIDIEN